MKTAESVSAGHVDKICDQISDAVLDEYLKQDPNCRVAIETMAGHGQIYLMGEITSRARVDIKKIVEDFISTIYPKSINDIRLKVCQQSPDIAQGVDNGGAGDQGIMVGYACNENESMIPQELFLARQVLKKLPLDFGPDAKTQVTLDDSNNIETIVLSAQHKEKQSLKPLYDLVNSYKPKNAFINPTGKYIISGLDSDTGLTGRKLAVDNYGPQIPIGGGCFSGKDPSKVDRSAAYMARKIAVDYLRKKGANEVFVKLAYSIGVAEPVMAIAIIDGKEEKITGYNLTPGGIIDFLDLKKPIYLETAKQGHFGNGFRWDK